MTDGYLSFRDDLVGAVVDLYKKGTLRYELERDFAVGDLIELRDESGKAFATAKVIVSIPINVHNVVYMDLDGLRVDGSGYETVAELTATLRQHYNEPDSGFDRHTRLDMLYFVVVDVAGDE